MNAVCVRRDSFVRTMAIVAFVGCAVAPASGCRSGSWVAKPSWMTFGQKAEDANGLASAPAGAGDVQKPSATAKPYPTTSTPEGYSLPDATAQAATVPGATPAAVTYGSTPPPAAVAAPTAQAASAAPASVTAPVAPQVGPYAPSVAATPAAVPPAATAPASPAWSSPPLAAVPPAAAEAAPATVSTAPPPWASTPAAATPEATPPERFADARAASPAWTPAPLEPPPADGRYAASGTSRFSGGTAAAAASFTPSAVPAELPPAVEPPPASGVPSSPAAPLRRPDPGYRPGGTSSYRPARSSLAGEPPAGVQPASYHPGQSVAR